MDTFNKVAQMLADHKGIDVNTITMDSTFAELQVDSLDVAELVMNFEDEFGISIELDEAVKRLEEIRPTGRIFFTIGSMSYLSIGGRIGKLAGKVSTVLGIRPIITLKEGEIFPSGVCRGRGKSLDKTLSVAREYLRENFTSADEFDIAVGYGYDYNEAAEFQGRVAALLDELGIPHGEIPIRLISSVIAVHTGPYPLGMGVLRKARLD